MPDEQTYGLPGDGIRQAAKSVEIAADEVSDLIKDVREGAGLAIVLGPWPWSFVTVPALPIHIHLEAKP